MITDKYIAKNDAIVEYSTDSQRATTSKLSRVTLGPDHKNEDSITTKQKLPCERENSNLSQDKSKCTVQENPYLENKAVLVDFLRELSDSEDDKESLFTLDVNNNDTGSYSVSLKAVARKPILIGFFIMLLCGGVSAGFLLIGVSLKKSEVQARFDRRGSELVQEIKSSWNEYEMAGLWLFQACRQRNITRQEFQELYEHLRYGAGLEFQAAEFILNVTHDERYAMEKQSRKFYSQFYPEIAYQGFVGFEPLHQASTEFSIQPRSHQPFYFPVHYVEPVESNMAAIDFDLYSSPQRRRTIDLALATWKPALTNRFRLVQEMDTSAYSVLLMHPGIPLRTVPMLKPKDLSLMVIRIPSLLARSTKRQMENLAVYIYDTTHINEKSQPPFLGGVEIRVNRFETASTSQLLFVEETELSQLLESKQSSLIHKESVEITSRTWTVVVLSLPGTYQTNVTYVVFGGLMILVLSICLLLSMYTNALRIVRIKETQIETKAEKAIVSSLFPAIVYDRLIQDTDARQNSLDGGKSLSPRCVTDDTMFGSKPIAEFLPEVSVVFADLVGFTAWSSVRDPSQVFSLLEIIFHSFDLIAQKLHVFKLETVGDCYVAAAGVPEPRDDHAIVMARFATKCVKKMKALMHSLETTLGPDTGELEVRVGLHSGPVTAGVLRGEKGRFQLFGDTMNTASRMESTGLPSKIHTSLETSVLLQASGKGNWLTPRETKVFVKGKGELQTFWLDICQDWSTRSISFSSVTSISCHREGDVTNAKTEYTFERHGVGEKIKECNEKKERLIQWNVDILSSMVKKIVARNMAVSDSKSSRDDSKQRMITPKLSFGKIIYNEVKDIVAIPSFDATAIKNEVSPASVRLHNDVVSQLTAYVRAIAYLYDKHPFHNFDHASHVTMSVSKLLGRIINSEQILVEEESIGEGGKCSSLHDRTFGIASDPLAQFACVFSALVHDVEHPGVPNSVLIREKSPLAILYNNKSVIEQNSVNIAWKLFMSDHFNKLRNCIFVNDRDNCELLRFRQIVVNAVMATDIIDEDLNALRRARWDKTIANSENPHNNTKVDSTGNELWQQIQRIETNRKATVVIEHVMQASDVSYTMQHWQIYCKWNERLFHEMFGAYKEGRVEKDPSEFWFQQEKDFFDVHIIPLAKKLHTCGIFGISSYEFLNYAIANRSDWEREGEAMIQEFVKNYGKSEK